MPLLLVWLVSALVTYGLHAQYVWRRFKADPASAHLIRLGYRNRLLRESLVIALPTEWAVWRMYLLGPLGTLAVWLTRATANGERS